MSLLLALHGAASEPADLLSGADGSRRRRVRYGPTGYAEPKATPEQVEVAPETHTPEAVEPMLPPVIGDMLARIAAEQAQAGMAAERALQLDAMRAAEQAMLVMMAQAMQEDDDAEAVMAGAMLLM